MGLVEWPNNKSMSIASIEGQQLIGELESQLQKFNAKYEDLLAALEINLWIPTILQSKFEEVQTHYWWFAALYCCG